MKPSFPKLPFSFTQKRLVAVGVLIVGSGMCLSVQGASPAEKILQVDRPLVIAHRGYPTVAPENTIPGFQVARLADADLVELDYHVDRDGVPIVIHDSTLDRTTNVVSAWGESDVKVEDKSLAEMQTLDAGSWYDSQFAGVHLPSLDEAVEVIQANGGMTLIERKAGPAEGIVAFLKEKGLVNELIVQSFDWDYVTEVHALLPEQVLGAIGPSREWKGKKLSREERHLSKAWIDEAALTGAKFLVWNAYIDRESIDYAHEKGFKLFIYTINDLDPAMKLLEAGVDGIITNNAAILWKALALMEN